MICLLLLRGVRATTLSSFCNRKHVTLYPVEWWQYIALKHSEKGRRLHSVEPDTDTINAPYCFWLLASLQRTGPRPRSSREAQHGWLGRRRGSFNNRKPIGEVGCCKYRMAERTHWWTDKCLEAAQWIWSCSCNNCSCSCSGIGSL